MSEQEFLSLSNLAGAEELFNQELEKVLADILDPNKKADAVRSVTLTYTIKPNEERDTAATEIKASSKLAARTAHKSRLYVGHDGKKAVAAQDDPRQRNLDFSKPEAEEPENVTSINQKKENEKK